MDNKEHKICRLCLSTCNGSFETIQNVNKEMLEVLLVNMDFDITDDCVKCKKCKDMLQKCFEFKSICFHTEQKLIIFIESRNSTRASMTQVYLEDVQNKKNKHFNFIKICRFCMKPTITYFDLDEIVDEYFGDMLQKFLPEVTLCFTNSPVSCSNCLDTLKSYFTFLKHLQLVEEHVKAYCETECETKSQKVKLSNVVRPILKKILTEKILIEELVEVCFSGLISKNCFMNKNKNQSVPLEKTMEELSNSGIFCLESFKKEDCIQNYIKTEEIEIKTDETVENHDDSEDDRSVPLEKPMEEQFNSENCYLKSCKKEDCNQNYIKSEEIEIKTDRTVESHDGSEDDRESKKAIEEQANSITNIRLNEETKANAAVRECLIKSKYKNSNRTEKNPKRFQCFYCKHVSTRKSYLTTHLRLIHGVCLLYCHHCSYKTDKEDRLKKHQAIHGDNGKYECPQCHKVYNTKQSIETHILRMHDNLRDLVDTKSKIHHCDICGYKTTFKSDLLVHINAMHSRLEKHQCNYCLYTCFRKLSLKRHISSVHLNLRPFSCRDCKKAFSQKYYLDRHIVSCHQKNADLMKTVTNKIYSCDHCTYRCVDKGILTRHSKVHKKKAKT